MIMTAIASVGLVVGRLGVAGRTSDGAASTVIEREYMREDCTFPRRRRMTLRAIRAELTRMHSRFSVTGGAGLRRTFKDIVEVALLALDVDVRAG